jgi:hypothetical protein
VVADIHKIPIEDIQISPEIRAAKTDDGSGSYCPIIID